MCLWRSAQRGRHFRHTELNKCEIFHYMQTYTVSDTPPLYIYRHIYSQVQRGSSVALSWQKCSLFSQSFASLHSHLRIIYVQESSQSRILIFTVKKINFSAHGFAKAPDPIHIKYSGPALVFRLDHTSFSVTNSSSGIIFVKIREDF